MIGGAHAGGQSSDGQSKSSTYCLSPQYLNQNGSQQCVEQRVVIEILENEGVKLGDIYRRLQDKYVVETFSCSQTFEWC